MNTPNGCCFLRLGVAAGAVAAVLALAGCRGVPTAGERAARRDFMAVSNVFQAGAAGAALASSPALADYLRVALLNEPSVQAAYFDWAAAVERITIARSMPDPRLTFEADITDIVMTLMPGLMQEFPGPGKLRAAASAAAAASQSKYFAFRSAVLQSAFALKRAYYELWFLDEKLRINRQTLELLGDLERIARAQNEVGKVTLQDVYRAQIERDLLATELENLEDSRTALVARFKGALGLTRDEADPPAPSRLESTPLDLTGGRLLDAAFARNPSLKAMEAEVRMAEAEIALARKAQIPDFSLGLMADAKAAPTMFRPSAGMTLPVWRDKLAAQAAAAQAAKQAAQARLTAEQIRVTVDFAMKTWEYREATRNAALLEDRLVPKARQSLDIARGAYPGGRIGFFDLLDAERTLLGFELQAVGARMRREVLLADLSLLIAGISPAGAPLPQDL